MTSFTPSSSDLNLRIDDLANLTLKAWDIPGMGLSIVYQGKDLKISGYGTKVRDGTDPVDEYTVFQIGSITKCFVSLALSMLVNQGKLQWDQPIIEYYPQLKFKDPIARQNVTLRDLMAHRSGLPPISRQAWRLWWSTKNSIKQIIELLGEVDPGSSFRSHFAYSNTAYLLATDIVHHVLKTPFKDYCAKNIFEPLHMTRTNMSLDFLKQDKNVASPHKLRKFVKEPIEWSTFFNNACGMNSCAKDMAHWLKYCLSGAQAIAYTQKPETVIEPEGIFDPLTVSMWSIFAHEHKITNYGLGWMMYTLNNHQILFHTGLIDGMQAIACVVPDIQLGICILTNTSIHLAAGGLLNQLLDIFLDIEKVDWLQKGLKVTSDYEKHIVKQLQSHEEKRAKNTTPSLPLDAYLGNYIHPAYGLITIKKAEDQLKIFLPSQEEGSLKHSQYDEFEIIGVSSQCVFPWLIEFQFSEDRREVVSLSMQDLGIFTKSKNPIYQQEVNP